jgi:hypothetical protein
MQMFNYLLHSWRERKMQNLNFSMILLWTIMGNSSTFSGLMQRAEKTIVISAMWLVLMQHIAQTNTI